MQNKAAFLALCCSLHEQIFVCLFFLLLKGKVCALCAFHLKAALINVFLRTIRQMTVCTAKGFTISNIPTEN